MLDGDYSEKLKLLLAKLPSRIRVPEEYREMFVKRGPVPTEWNDRRRCARFHFGNEAILQVNASMPGLKRETTYSHIYTKDLSRRGISFLNHEQLFPGEQVTLWLTNRKIDCVIMHCVRQGPDCYVVGAALGTEIPNDRFERLKNV